MFRQSSALLVFFGLLFAFAATVVGATSTGNGGAAGSWGNAGTTGAFGNWGTTTAWGGGGPVPTAAPTATPTPSPSAAPSVLYVQTFAQSDPTTTPAASITVTLGTSGTGAVAPLTGNDLIAILQSAGNGISNPHFATPASPWVAIPGGSLDTLSLGGESSIDVFRLPAGNTKPASITFSTVSGAVVEAQATIVEVANAASFEVILSGGVAASVSSGYVSTTGTGTAAIAQALPIVVANLEDYSLSLTQPSGYTQLSNGDLLGNGSTAFALDGYVGYGALLASTAVASSTVTWVGESGTVRVAGMKVLAEPAAGASPSPSPSPTATPSPSPSPTATVSGVPTLANGGFANGHEIPTGPFASSGWLPFASTSAWNTPVCNAVNNYCATHPTYLSQSAAAIANTFAGNSIGQPVRSQEPGPYDNAYSIYFASASDPVVNLVCGGISSFCDTADNGGIPATIHIPAQARAPGCNSNNCTGYYSDAIMAIVQPNGTIIDTAYAQPTMGRNWQAGDTLTAGGVGNCGSIYTGTGVYGTSTGTTSAGECSPVGVMRASELLAGHINHALAVLSSCIGSTGNGVTPLPAQYPAFAGASESACTNGAIAGVPQGARLWYDVPDATTNANGALAPWEKAILNALHDYGGYLTDIDSGGASQSYIHFMPSSDEQSYAFGLVSPYAALQASPNNWTSAPISGALGARYFGGDNNGSGNWAPNVPSFASHLHWLNACSARGTC